jgi:hypothetical protein
MPIKSAIIVDIVFSPIIRIGIAGATAIIILS